MSNYSDYIEYYKYGYDDNVPVIPAEDRGEGPATDKEVAEAVAKALASINLIPNGEKSYTLDINGRDAGEIVIPDDKYLTDIETNDETKEVNFKVSNGEDIKIALDKLDDPNIDCSTY